MRVLKVYLICLLLVVLHVGCAEKEPVVKPLVPMPEERATAGGGAAGRPQGDSNDVPLADPASDQPAAEQEPKKTKPAESVSFEID